MRPLLLVGILAVSGATGCSRGSDAPAVQPGVAAGKVVEVSGQVLATRGGATRPLAAGAEVSGDDVIETAADGHVVIVLAHNNARWELNKNQSVKVGESDAWSEPKREGVATAGDEATTTAGRHGETMAASTSSTGARPPAAEERAALDEPASAPAAAAPAPAPDPAALPPSPPPPPPPVRNERGGDAPAPGGAFSGQGAIGAPSSDARAPSRRTPPPVKDAAPPPPKAAVKLERERASTTSSDDGMASAGGEHASVETAFAPILTQMKQCVTGNAEVRLTVTVEAGVASLAYMDGTPAADVARCLERHAKTLKLAAPNKDRVRFRAIVRAR